MYERAVHKMRLNFNVFKNNERDHRQFALNYYVSCVYVYIVICGDIEIFIFLFQLKIMLLFGKTENYIFCSGIRLPFLGSLVTRYDEEW